LEDIRTLTQMAIEAGWGDHNGDASGHGADR
jgi:hypothetical protein